MYTFSTSILMFWIKGQVDFDSKFVRVRVPNTVMGVFPLGSKEDMVPLNTISNVQIDTKYKLVPLVIGGFLALSSLGNLVHTGLGGLIFLAIWIAVAGSGIRTTLTFDKSGSQQVISVPFFEQKQLYAIKEEIYDRLSEYESSKDLDMYFERK